MDDLIQEYQAGITALQQRQKAIQEERKRLRGEEYFAAGRRLQALIDEEQDMLFALRLLARRGN